MQNVQIIDFVEDLNIDRALKKYYKFMTFVLKKYYKL